jgi:hypothetical protein
MAFSDYNPGFASPDSVYMKRQPTVVETYGNGSTLQVDSYGNYTVTDMETGQTYPVAAPTQQAAPAPVPTPPMPATFTGFPQSAWSQALKGGLASGKGVRQIMAEYNPGMYGNQYQAPAPAMNPAEALMAQMQAPPPPPPPTGTSMGVSGSGPMPGAPAPRPGLQRMAGRFPGIANRMGYQPTMPNGMPAPPMPPMGRNQNRQGR